MQRTGGIMAEKEKSKGQLLADKLFIKLDSCWEGIDEKTEKEVEEFSSSYKQ